MNNLFVIPLFFTIIYIWRIEGTNTTKQNPASASWSIPAGADTLRNPYANQQDAIKAGKKIYEKACWSCHGLDGKGTGPAAAGLKTKPADHTSASVQSQSDGVLFYKITRGKGEMTPFDKTLSKAQRWKLVSYLRTLK